MSFIIWCNFVIIICVVIALQAMQLLHERNIKRAIFASKCRAFKLESSWNKWNFISRYLLHLTSIKRNFCIFEMRQINFIIWCNYIIIICWNAWCATIASSHYIKKIVLKFLKRRIECLKIFFFENWIF